MQVQIDDVWCSPSTLHVRVTCYDEDGRWRHRYYPTMALAQIPVEALAPLIAHVQDEETGGVFLDVPLF